MRRLKYYMYIKKQWTKCRFYNPKEAVKRQRHSKDIIYLFLPEKSENYHLILTFCSVTTFGMLLLFAVLKHRRITVYQVDILLSIC